MMASAEKKVKKDNSVFENFLKELNGFNASCNQGGSFLNFKENCKKKALETTEDIYLKILYDFSKAGRSLV